MIRAVLDTNALVSAAIKPEGKPAQIYAQAATRYVLLCSDFIVHEIESVLPRQHIQKKYPSLVTLQLQTRFIADLRSVATMVVSRTMLKVVKEDEKDNQVLACALDGHADYLVTGDRHLLALKLFHRIRIITPTEFFNILNLTALRDSVTPKTRPENFKAMRRRFIEYLGTRHHQ